MRAILALLLALSLTACATPTAPVATPPVQEAVAEEADCGTVEDFERVVAQLGLVPMAAGISTDGEPMLQMMNQDRHMVLFIGRNGGVCIIGQAIGWRVVQPGNPA